MGLSPAAATSSSGHQPTVLHVRRPLPDKVLVGYATECNEKVLRSVRDGVNVVIWSFVELVEVDHESEQQEQQVKDNDGTTTTTAAAKCVATFDLECAKRMIAQLDAEGYTDTVHLVSFGGWNGPHLPDSLNVRDMYNAWKELLRCGVGGDDDNENDYQTLFHGVDWDLEGHDAPDSPTNTFSKNCLEAMGEFSDLAKQDGFLVGMAPPQSYLDIEEPMGSFSRRVNLTTDDYNDENENDHGQNHSHHHHHNSRVFRKGWHDDFSYFGRNVYAHLLSKHGASIDFVSVQFYESYSRAGWQVFDKRMPPHAYLRNYVEHLVVELGEEFWVDFDDDDDGPSSLGYSSRMVPFPLSKLVLGFANGWGANNDNNDDTDKVCYFDPQEIAIAYKALSESNNAPRGFMFWVIGEEGNKNIHFSRSLGNILGTRTATTKEERSSSPSSSCEAKESQIKKTE